MVRTEHRIILKKKIKRNNIQKQMYLPKKGKKWLVFGKLKLSITNRCILSEFSGVEI